MDSHLACAVDEQQAAEPVPLDLEKVFLRAEGSLGSHGLHRPDGGGEPVQLDGELVGHHARG